MEWLVRHIICYPALFRFKLPRIGLLCQKSVLPVSSCFRSLQFLIRIFAFSVTFGALCALESVILTSWAVFLNFCLKFPRKSCIIPLLIICEMIISQLLIISTGRKPEYQGGKNEKVHCPAACLCYGLRNGRLRR